MRRFVVAISLLALGFLLQGIYSQANMRKDEMLSHDVYFTLAEKNAANASKLVAACHKYLKGHPGEVFYSAGVLCEDLKRPVNDLEFDVALHITFQDKASQDKYQDAKRHLDFIAENKSLWKKVRVFDSYVAK